MKILIIEDESAAARNLAAIVEKVIPGAEILGVLESIEQTVEWFGGNPAPDLLLMDIHLADGESFRVFDSVDVACPVIFTTAYDEYALEAFKVNSIDYLLKPIKEEELKRAIAKLERLSKTELAQRHENLVEVARKGDEQKVFLIHVRDKIVPLKVEDVAFFYTTDERVKAFDREGNAFPMDKSLDKMQRALSETEFFRANRQFVVARWAIEEIAVWFGHRLSLGLKVKTPERIVISKDRVPEFKRWFMGV